MARSRKLLPQPVQNQLARQGKQLGMAQILVLWAISRLGPDAYGALILTDINARIERDNPMTHAQLYVTLKRLRDRKLIKVIGTKRLASSPPLKIQALTAAGDEALAIHSARAHALVKAISRT